MTSCADELSQVLMHQSRGQHSLRLLLLVVIVLQLYISNSLSLPSICGIIMCCAVYAAYDAFKSKCFLDIKPLPSPSPSQELPQLPGAVLDPHHSELSQCPSSDAVSSYGPLPSASLSLESVSGASPAAVQSEHLEIQRLRHSARAPAPVSSQFRPLLGNLEPRVVLQDPVFAEKMYRHRLKLQQRCPFLRGLLHPLYLLAICHHS
jgi:hypothetical protein